MVGFTVRVLIVSFRDSSPSGAGQLVPDPASRPGHPQLLQEHHQEPGVITRCWAPSAVTGMHQAPGASPSPHQALAHLPLLQAHHQEPEAPAASHQALVHLPLLQGITRSRRITGGAHQGWGTFRCYRRITRSRRITRRWGTFRCYRCITRSRRITRSGAPSAVTGIIRSRRITRAGASSEPSPINVAIIIFGVPVLMTLNCWLNLV